MWVFCLILVAQNRNLFSLMHGGGLLRQHFRQRARICKIFFGRRCSTTYAALTCSARMYLKWSMAINGAREFKEFKSLKKLSQEIILQPCDQTVRVRRCAAHSLLCCRSLDLFTWSLCAQQRSALWSTQTHIHNFWSGL